MARRLQNKITPVRISASNPRMLSGIEVFLVGFVGIPANFINDALYERTKRLKKTTLNHKRRVKDGKKYRARRKARAHAKKISSKIL